MEFDGFIWVDLSVEPRGPVTLDRLDLDARRSLKLIFANGMRLHLGSKEMETRLGRFIAIFPRIQDEMGPDNKLLDVDLRYSNGLTVRWEQKQKMPDAENPRSATGTQSGRV